MGNNQTKASIEKTPIFEVIRDEFLSLTSEKLTFEQLCNFKIPKNFQGDVDLNKIETLFVLDHDKDGVFSLDDMTHFCLIFSNSISTGPDWDLANRFNTECISRFTHAIDSQGPEKISEWILSLVTDRSRPTMTQESVMLLFRLFASLTGETMDSLKFFRLLRRDQNSVLVLSSTIVSDFLVPFLSCYVCFHNIHNDNTIGWP